MTTKFAQGQKVYEVKDGNNIFIYTVDRINIESNIDKEGVKTEIRYFATRKERIGLLQTEVKDLEFTEDDVTMYASKNEALKYIEELKEAKEKISKNEADNREDNSGYNSLYDYYRRIGITL